MPAAPAPSFDATMTNRPVDAALSAQAQADQSAPLARIAFHFTADADASILARAIETVLRRGAAPSAVDAKLEDGGWRIALTVTGVTDAEARHIALTLGQIVGVRGVVAHEAAS